MTLAFLSATAARRLLQTAAARPRLVHHGLTAATRPTPVPRRTRACSSSSSSHPPQPPPTSPPPPPPPPSPPGPTMVRARHILVDSEEMVDAARQQLDAGASSFADLAATLSTCPSKARGGDLGWFRRRTMVREFEDAAFGNAPGSVLKVKSDFGWHLILVEGHGTAAEEISVHDFARRFDLSNLQPQPQQGGSAGGDGDAGAPPSNRSVYDLERASVQLIDVRERHEVELASLPGFFVLPMGEYELWADDFESGALGFDKNKETIVMCHHGVRSANFCAFLSQSGFTVVRNLTGGIDAYSREIDPSVPKY